MSEEMFNASAYELRARVLAQVRQIAGVEDVYLGRWSRQPGGVRFDYGQTDATDELTALIKAHEGVLALDGTSVNVFERLGWDLTRPLQAQINRFRHLYEDVQDPRAHIEDSVVGQSMYIPLEISCQARAFVYDDQGRALGQLAALRRGGGSLSDATRDALNRGMLKWRPMLIRAQELDDAVSQGGTFYAVIRPIDGEVELATPGFLEALDATQLDELRRWSKHCYEDGQQLSNYSLRGVSVQRTLLRGPQGPRDLVTVLKVSLPALDPLYRFYSLQPRQRQLVQLLEQGLSNKQIARELGLSVDTVKYHLKKLYQELDVSTRAALLKRFRGQLKR